MDTLKSFSVGLYYALEWARATQKQRAFNRALLILSTPYLSYRLGRVHPIRRFIYRYYCGTHTWAFYIDCAALVLGALHGHYYFAVRPTSRNGHSDGHSSIWVLIPGDDSACARRGVGISIGAANRSRYCWTGLTKACVQRSATVLSPWLNGS